MYTPIDVNNATPEEILSKLIEAQTELAIYSNNPLIGFFKGLKVQLEGITDQINTTCMIDLTEPSITGVKSMSDKVLDMIYKAEKLVQLIESIGTKHFPEIYKIDTSEENRSTESYVKKRDRQLGREGKTLPS